ncbi:hypothetical protein CR513_51146, partial [Mucuna pruriens]
MALKIKDLNLEFALHSMIMTLGMFSNSLCKKPLASMRAQASDYIQMEEMVEGGVAKAQIRSLHPFTMGKATLLEEAFNAELIAFSPLKEGTLRS